MISWWLNQLIWWGSLLHEIKFTRFTKFPLSRIIFWTFQSAFKCACIQRRRCDNAVKNFVCFKFHISCLVETCERYNVDIKKFHWKFVGNFIFFMSIIKKNILNDKKYFSEFFYWRGANDLKQGYTKLINNKGKKIKIKFVYMIKQWHRMWLRRKKVK